MAEFITRHSIIHHLRKIIKNAKKELVLISPYIKADEETKELLKGTERSTTINVVYGKKELQPEEQRFLEELSIRSTFRENLHAKCYLNENEALLTSMNLYEFSMENNDEMGILVSRENDPDLYEEIYREAKRYIGNKETRAATARIEAAGNDRERSAARATPRSRNRAGAATKTPKAGFCIRCKADLPPDPTKPYCSDCFVIWKLFENENYKEKHCHTCGKGHASTLLRPVCPTCYRKYKTVLEFAKP